MNDSFYGNIVKEELGKGFTPAEVAEYMIGVLEQEALYWGDGGIVDLVITTLGLGEAAHRFRLVYLAQCEQNLGSLRRNGSASLYSLLDELGMPKHIKIR